ncbi:MULTISPECIES: hypothetical protein [unclassified Streptomyces]|uniref:hypothetical protein n=1 Tax=unclassified Streptomyces TaxID=2593676 RepID=UPI0022595C66|nr:MULTISPECIES: hypothetical protein [unclassified Streptomyces]MCX4884314.1 hypothetical protein [Streptomyces sp. NBC_00847]MCX5051764.1 hypothetical protein [Streptomyces sp. NBC_00474]MCX5062093.1 hypothetical protein [Streptomyces sp. NBC_00452]MCX5249658.1 hypothetical protein [Streptomyces sp. NBC_00201]MCX5292298.1 hypothetical protein [Streptomyces sp. NBC_00183]
MFRGTTARTALALVAGVLLALQFFTPTASFAAAHTSRHVVVKALPGTKLSGKALRDETGTFRGCGHTGDPTGPLRTRDRHVNTGCTSEEPERQVLAQDPASVHEPVALRGRHLSRPSTSHSPAALQVFRC